MTEELLHRGPGRPRKEPLALDPPAAQHGSIADTPEFIEAIAQAKADLHREIEPLLTALKQSRGQGEVDGDQMSFARQMAIAEIADQDQGRKRTAPEELAKRARARAQMDAAIARARRKSDDYKTATGQKVDPGPDAPLYLATGKVYLDETLVEPFEVDPATKKPYPVTFMWLAAPSEAMRPVNEAAKEIFEHFTVSIGGQSEVVAPQAQSWITAGGLVIQGIHGIPVSRKGGAPDAEQLAGDFYQRGPGQFDPRRSEINILGTVAAPAKHLAQGEPEPRRGI